MEIPEKPKCSNIEENYPTDHIRPAEVMDGNDPPVYVKSELKQSNYVQHLGVVEEYVDIEFDKLKLGDEIYDTESKRKGDVRLLENSTRREKCVGIDWGVHNAIYSIEEFSYHWRLVVKTKLKQPEVFELNKHHLFA